MAENIYAPVIIPTLCRFEHFRNCVESLAACTDADKTELYIGLDYPSKEEHWEGYRKIDKYVDTITGFKNVYIYRREKNFGVSKNIRDLRSRVREKYDRYISSEDDNTFSPNFLQYMNQGLELYKDNPKVMAICGYAYPYDYCRNLSDYKYDIYPMHSYCAWGTGFWLEKIDVISPYINSETAFSIIYSWKSVYRLFKLHLHITVHRLLFRSKNAYGDLLWHVYCLLNDCYCIYPLQSKVRNNGFDGSGLNCSIDHIYSTQAIDTNLTYAMEQIPIKEYAAAQLIHKKLYEGKWWIRRLCEIEYILFRMGVNTHKGFLLEIHKKTLNNKKK